jgi:imidazolonepropionase-like amidohydrolase
MTTVIRSTRLFDGRTFVGVRDVLVDGERVAAVDEMLDIRADNDVDARGMTLLPGLIDCHVHAFGDALVEALTFGVTTVVDMFTDRSFAATWRAEQARGEAVGRADLHSAGHPATAPGGHGTQYGIPIATLSSPEEADAFVRDRFEEGSDFLKIIWEDGAGDWATLDADTVRALVEATHRRGRIAVIHVTRQHHARAAIEAGVDGLAHVFRDEPPAQDVGRFVADAGAFVIPTLSVIAGATGEPYGAVLTTHERFRRWLTPKQVRSLTTADDEPHPPLFEHAAQAVTELIKAGARVLAGTDASNQGTAHGASIHREIELLTECGMTPAQALAAATSEAAAAFGLDARGVVRPGARADLLLVDGDPSQRIADTREIAGVWKQGVRFDLDARALAVAGM